MGKQLSITLIFDYSYSLNEFSFFDIGQKLEIINFEESKKQFAEDYKNLFHNELVDLITLTTKLKTPVSAYFSGTFLTLLQQVDKPMLTKLNTAVNKYLELLTGPYCNSLSPAFSLTSAIEEINQHQDYLKSLFSIKCNKSHIFENIYSNEVSKQLNNHGITTSFAGAIDWYVNGETDNKIFKAHCNNEYNILLPDQDLGDSVFNNMKQKNHFLQLNISSLKKLNGIKNIITKAKAKATICSLDDQILSIQTEKKYSIKTPIMSGPTNINLDKLRSNILQNSAIKHYYLLKNKAKKAIDPNIMKSWLLLGHSDYFLQMDRDNNDSAYNIYSNYMNILNDLELRIESKSSDT